MAKLRVDLIDVSHWQPLHLPMKEFKAKGLKGLYNKATESTTFVDNSYTTRRAAAKKAGLPFGAYHFASAKTTPEAQAYHFLKNATPKPGDLLPVLDFEHEDFAAWSLAKRDNFVSRFIDVIVKELGVRPVLYTMYDLGTTHNCMLWTARYSDSNTLPVPEKPWKAYDMWQFSNGQYGDPKSFCGHNVDLNVLARPRSFKKDFIIPRVKTNPEQGQPQPQAPKNKWSDVTTAYQGKRLNYGTYYLMKAANKMLHSSRYGKEREDVTITQGSYNGGGVAASAGTHDAGGAVDITSYNSKNRLTVFRKLGMALWLRTSSQGPWPEHMHGIVDGDGTASAGAKRQVEAYHNRRNGLANNAMDDGPQVPVFPLFVYPETERGKPGVVWFKKNSKSYEWQTRKSEVRREYKKGDRTEIVAVTSVRKGIIRRYWGVTADGQCIRMARLSRTEVKVDAVPTPVTKTTKRIKMGHASMQFSDTDVQMAHDSSALSDRARKEQLFWVTGTEAGSGADPLRSFLRRDFSVAGYKFWMAQQNDAWFAVREDLIEKGSWETYWKMVIPGEAKKHTAKGVTYVKFFCPQLNRYVAVFAAHYLTKGRPGARDPQYAVNLEANRKLANEIDKKVKELSATGVLCFYGGDQNIVDRDADTFFGGLFLSSWDELKKYQNTGHGNIDVIACHDPLNRTRAISVKAYTDSLFSLNTDHFYIDSAYDTEVIQ